jgi:hypothetical protein
LHTDTKGCLRIEIQTFGGIFQFTQVCDMSRQQRKKIGIRADLANTLWRGDDFPGFLAFGAPAPTASVGFFRALPSMTVEGLF